MYYEIFGGFWTVFFVGGLTTFILGSSASIWYYSNDTSGNKPHSPITTSIARAFRYHLGSIAFGSLLLALLAFIRTLVALL
jgi:choline transporter-like protein 2/4/5